MTHKKWRFTESHKEYYEEGWSPSSLPNSVVVSYIAMGSEVGDGAPSLPS